MKRKWLALPSLSFCQIVLSKNCSDHIKYSYHLCHFSFVWERNPKEPTWQEDPAKDSWSALTFSICTFNAVNISAAVVLGSNWNFYPFNSESSVTDFGEKEIETDSEWEGEREKEREIHFLRTNRQQEGRDISLTITELNSANNHRP